MIVSKSKGEIVYENDFGTVFIQCLFSRTNLRVEKFYARVSFIKTEIF